MGKGVLGASIASDKPPLHHAHQAEQELRPTPCLPWPLPGPLRLAPISAGQAPSSGLPLLLPACLQCHHGSPFPDRTG